MKREPSAFFYSSGWIVFLFALLSAALWLPFAIRGALFYDTLFDYFYPNSIFLRDSIFHGSFPFWNPYLYSGVPFLANLQSALFYPFTYLILVLSYPWTIFVFTTAHALLAGIFFYAFAREEGLSIEAAFLSGCVFCLNGFFTLHYAYPTHFASYVWLPLILLFLGRALKKPSFASLAAGAMALAFQIFAGHPQFAFYSVVATLIYSLGSVFRRIGDCGVKRVLASWMAILVWGGAIAAIQVLPFLNFMTRSVRLQGMNYSWATYYSVKPWEFLVMAFCPLWNNYFVPSGGDPHILGFYFGWTALMLSAWALCALRRDLWISFAAIAGLGSVWSLGSHFPPYYLLCLSFPPLHWIRFPAQANYLVCVGVSMLAGLGLDALSASLKAKRLLIFICCLELFLFARKSVITMPFELFSGYTPPVAAFLKSRSGDGRVLLSPKSRQMGSREGISDLDAWRKFADSLYSDLAMLYDIHDIAGDEQMRYASYEHVLDEVFKNPRSSWLNALSVRYVLTFWDMPAPWFHRIKVANASIHVFENTKALPRAYFVTQARYLPESDIIKFPITRSDFSRQVILSKKDLDVGFKEPRRSVWVQVFDSGPNHVSAYLDAPSPGWVVMSDSYDAGWSASINGRRVKVLRANFIQRAVRVPPGRLRVDFQYRPLGFWFFAVISLVSLFLAGIAMIFFRAG